MWICSAPLRPLSVEHHAGFYLCPVPPTAGAISCRPPLSSSPRRRDHPGRWNPATPHRRARRLLRRDAAAALFFAGSRKPSLHCRCCRLDVRRVDPRWIVYPRMPILHSSSTSGRIVCATGGRDHWHQLQLRDEYGPEHFWLSLIKDVIWSFRSLVIFLAEQPAQLKYIEWPSFQSTLKTAILTLVIVALLIVALSSVDSALCYILTLLLRRTARPL